MQQKETRNTHVGHIQIIHYKKQQRRNTKRTNNNNTTIKPKYNNTQSYTRNRNEYHTYETHNTKHAWMKERQINNTQQRMLFFTQAKQI